MVSSMEDKNIESVKFLLNYPNYIENSIKLLNLNINNDIEDLKDLLKYYQELQKAYYIASGYGYGRFDLGIYRTEDSFDRYLDQISNRINELLNQEKNIDVEFDPNEIINGYSVKKYIQIEINYLDVIEF